MWKLYQKVDWRFADEGGISKASEDEGKVSLLVLTLAQRRLSAPPKGAGGYQRVAA
jgi:hypothetical protein